MCILTKKKNVLSSVVVSESSDTHSEYGSNSPLPERTHIAREKNNKHLIVDDSSLNRLVLKRVLNDEGVHVEEAEGAKQCIAKIMQQGEFCIVWMDIRLGNQLSGTETTRLLQQHYGYKGVIIGLTGYGDDKTHKEALACGMTHCINKPFSTGVVCQYSKDYS
jgi:CheY-like chemotaxis protein